ncbi:hypothetical protein A0130_02980 [Leifsonia xyli]|uniref:DUF2283 domain-containing protein n=1 Tax=Leifsonia xyli TaxID=1575 RepID=UPI0007CD9F67|nr:hypothetical protein A0130_02980 [Leifsonia xyli]
MDSIIVDTTYDPQADAGYISFDRIAPGEAARQILVEDEELGPFSVILDVDSHGKLLGIELLGVTQIVARPRLSANREGHKE